MGILCWTTIVITAALLAGTIAIATWVTWRVLRE